MWFFSTSNCLRGVFTISAYIAEYCNNYYGKLYILCKHAHVHGDFVLFQFIGHYWYISYRNIRSPSM